MPNRPVGARNRDFRCISPAAGAGRRSRDPADQCWQRRSGRYLGRSDAYPREDG